MDKILVSTLARQSQTSYICCGIKFTYLRMLTFPDEFFVVSKASSQNINVWREKKQVVVISRVSLKSPATCFLKFIRKNSSLVAKVMRLVCQSIWMIPAKDRDFLLFLWFHNSIGSFWVSDIHGLSTDRFIFWKFKDKWNPACKGSGNE